MSKFIYDWQQLIGAGIGPFLAVVLSAYAIRYQELKEGIRRAEISLTRSVNDIYDIREELEGFVKRLDEVIKEINKINDDTSYCFSETNFTPITDVFHDIDLPNIKTKSYYLHNKILHVDAGVKTINKALDKLREEYRNLIEKNERMAAMGQKAREQRLTYTQNLESFRKLIEGFVSYAQSGIRTIIQGKVYISKIRNNRYFVWEKEGVTFKFFKNKVTMAKNRNLELIDHIDSILDEEVNKKLELAEGRAAKKYNRGT